MKYRIILLGLLISFFILFCSCERESLLGYKCAIIDVIPEGISLSPPNELNIRTATIPASGAIFSFTTTGERKGTLYHVLLNGEYQPRQYDESNIELYMSVKADWGSIDGYYLGELYKSDYKVDCIIDRNPSSEPRVFRVDFNGVYTELKIVITQEGSK